MAMSSFSYVDDPSARLEMALLYKVMGLSFCISPTPNPPLNASASTINVFAKSGKDNTGACTMTAFSYWNVAFAFLVNLNLSFFNSLVSVAAMVL